MKKLLGIVVLGLLLSGNAYAKVSLKELVKVGSSKSEVCKAGGAIRGFTLKEDLGSQLCHSISKDNFAYNSTNRTEILSTGSGAWFVFENVTRPMKCGAIFCRKGDGTLKKLFLELDYSNKIETRKAAYKFASIPLPIEIAEEKKQRAEAIASGDLTFTIKDKKEQCTAIGFTPATDKFADCVLRLVELDLKTQLNNSAVASANQTNSELANELKNQRRSDVLLDLGQRLLNPSSPVSTMSTRTCSVRGTGTMKRVTCY